MKIVLRGKYSSETIEHSKVGILKRILSGECRLSMRIGIPRTELAAGSYFTGWERIVHGEVVEERTVAADRGQSQFVNLELQNCMRFAAVDLQNRSVKNDFSDVTTGWSFSPICLG